MYHKNFLTCMLLVFSIIYCLDVKAFSDIDYITTIEKTLFNVEYTNENINSRLTRIEKNVFGVSDKATTQQRIQKLKKAFGDINNTYSQQQSNMQSKNIVTNPQFRPIEPLKTKPRDPSVQYPVVNEIEARVLGNVYAQDDVYNRLNRLEATIFNRNFNDALNDRVERLKLTVLGVQNTQQSGNNSNILSESLSPVDDTSANAILGRLEQETFNTTYPNEPVESRLARLEANVFGQPSPDDPEEERIERLAAVITAQPASELYRDMSQLRQYQTISTRITAAALILMLIKGLIF